MIDDGRFRRAEFHDFLNEKELPATRDGDGYDDLWANIAWESWKRATITEPVLLPMPQKAGEYITLIRDLRTETGCTLKVAKEAIDAAQSDYAVALEMVRRPQMLFQSDTDAPAGEGDVRIDAKNQVDVTREGALHTDGTGVVDQEKYATPVAMVFDTPDHDASLPHAPDMTDDVALEAPVVHQHTPENAGVDTADVSHEIVSPGVLQAQMSDESVLARMDTQEHLAPSLEQTIHEVLVNSDLDGDGDVGDSHEILRAQRTPQFHYGVAQSTPIAVHQMQELAWRSTRSVRRSARRSQDL